MMNRGMEEAWCVNKSNDSHSQSQKRYVIHIQSVSQLLHCRCTSTKSFWIYIFLTDYLCKTSVFETVLCSGVSKIFSQEVAKCIFLSPKVVLRIRRQLSLSDFVSRHERTIRNVEDWRRTWCFTQEWTAVRYWNNCKTLQAHFIRFLVDCVPTVP